MSQAVERHPGFGELTDREWTTIEKKAAVFAQSSACPVQFKGKPNDVIAAALTLRDLGMDLTFTTLSRIYIINGGVVLAAQVLLGLATAEGHDVRFMEQDASHCTVSVQRKGEDFSQSFTVTIEDAKTAALASKDNWKHFPMQMLMAWATRVAIRATLPHLILGIRGLAELPDPIGAPSHVDAETGEFIDPTAGDDEPAEGEIVNASGPVPSPTPPVPVADLADSWDRDELQQRIDRLDDEFRDVETEQKEAWSKRQRHSNAALGALGIKGDDRHDAVREATGGETESTGRLTAAQLDAVVAWCEARTAETVQDELSPDEFDK